MSSFSRLIQVGYVLGLSLTLSLLLWPSGSQAQFGISSGYRATQGLPTIAIPTISGSSSAAGAAGGITGISGGAASASGSFSTQIMYVQLGDFFPNGGRIIGMPMPPLQFMLNNFLTDTTGAPWAMLAVGRVGHRHGIGVGMPGRGGIGLGGLGMPVRGGVSGIGGLNMSNMSSMSMGSGMGGFAGKGMGGFSGRKGL